MDTEHFVSTVLGYLFILVVVIIIGLATSQILKHLSGTHESLGPPKVWRICNNGHEFLINSKGGMVLDMQMQGFYLAPKECEDLGKLPMEEEK